MPRALVVDDDTISCAICQYLLNQSGYTVDITHSGEDAFSLVSSQEYQLIIMDMGLPHMSGLETSNKIRNVLNNDIFIIALTAHVDHIKDELDACHVNAFHQKPLTQDILKQILKQIPSAH